jgi:hypothetical protein
MDHYRRFKIYRLLPSPGEHDELLKAIEDATSSLQGKVV